MWTVNWHRTTSPSHTQRCVVHILYTVLVYILLKVPVPAGTERPTYTRFSEPTRVCPQTPSRSVQSLLQSSLYAQHTYAQTTLRATCTEKGRITYALRVGSRVEKQLLSVMSRSQSSLNTTLCSNDSVAVCVT